jgi:hypothetical protein
MTQLTFDKIEQAVEVMNDLYSKTNEIMSKLLSNYNKYKRELLQKHPNIHFNLRWDNLNLPYGYENVKLFSENNDWYISDSDYVDIYGTYLNEGSYEESNIKIPFSWLTLTDEDLDKECMTWVAEILDYKVGKYLESEQKRNKEKELKLKKLLEEMSKEQIMEIIGEKYDK